VLSYVIYVQVRTITTLGNGEWSDLVVVVPVSTSEDESSTSVAAIVVGVLVGIGVVIIAIVVAVCVISRYKNRIKIYDHTVRVEYINYCLSMSVCFMVTEWSQAYISVNCFFQQETLLTHYSGGQVIGYQFGSSSLSWFKLG